MIQVLRGNHIYMYKLNPYDAVQLANDIKDIAAKVEKHNESKTLMFSPKLGATFIVNTDKEPLEHGYDPIIQVDP